MSLACMAFAAASADTTHTVIAGETLSAISQKYGVTVESIIQHNPRLADSFYAGMVLTIPTTQKASSSQTRTTATQTEYRASKKGDKPFFDRNDNLFSINCGYGFTSGEETSGSLQPQISWEHVIVSGLIHNKACITLGAQVGYGMTTDEVYLGKAAGVYDYQYSVTRWNYKKNAGGRYMWSVYQTDQNRRTGTGSADVYADVQEFSAMFTAGFHFQPIKKLDVFAKVGAGPCFRMFDLDFENVVGLSKKTSDPRPSKPDHDDIHFDYSYNDFSHAEWGGSNVPKDFVIGGAICFNVGGSYYFSKNMAVNLQLGLTNGLVSSCSPTSVGFFTLGLTYRL